MTYYKVKSTAKKVSKSVVQNSKKLSKKVALGARAINDFAQNGFNGRETASAIADFIPIVGNVKGAYEATFGKDPITGRKLGKVERAAAGAAVIGGPLVKGGTRGVKVASGIVSGGKKSSGKVRAAKGADKGEYSKVGGHHVHAKAGCKENVNYDQKKGFNISQKFMKENGLNHQKMTNKQRELFKELNESGRPNKLQEHTRIAVEALMAGGGSRQESRDLVAASLKNLRQQGVREPSNIPWYK